MTSMLDTRVKRRWSAGLLAGTVLTAVLALGTFSGTAGAEERRDHRNRGEHRGWNDDHRGWRGENRGYNGGYYRSPPVVYREPYARPYYEPPVVYGPGIGLNLNIR